jgi:hypothetical protein
MMDLSPENWFPNRPAQPHARRSSTAAVVLLALVVAAGAVATPAGVPSAFANSRRSDAAPAALPPAEPFAMNLYGEGDFVPQHTFEWCVGASIQMTINMIEPVHRSSYADQQRLWELARARSFSQYRGANSVGWAVALNELGLGPYGVMSVPDYNEALRVAAAAIRETERPVGLLMWRGRHAWVMSGFESIGDPAIHPDFQVTGVRVLDPLYPYGSGVWGPSPEPNSLLTPDELGLQFVIREARGTMQVPTGYVLILPSSPGPAPLRQGF